MYMGVNGQVAKWIRLGVKEPCVKTLSLRPTSDKNRPASGNAASGWLF